MTQRATTFGGHYYDVADKTGHEWTIALSRRGLLQFEPSDLCHPKKVRMLEITAAPDPTVNLLYLDFPLEAAGKLLVQETDIRC